MYVSRFNYKSKFLWKYLHAYCNWLVIGLILNDNRFILLDNNELFNKPVPFFEKQNVKQIVTKSLVYQIYVIKN